MCANLTRRAKHPPPAKTRQPFPIKIFHFTEIRNYVIHPPIPVQGEGRSSVVTNVDRGAVDAAASGTRRRDQGEMNLVRSCLACGRTAPVSGEASWRSRIAAYGKIVWSWPSLLRSSLAEMDRGSTGSLAIVIRKATVTKRNSSPGRARHKPSAHCAGKAECSASPVCCCAVSLRYIFAQRTAGASRHPVFPAPSSQRRGKERSKTRVL
jgi:hypothetical protein